MKCPYCKGDIEPNVHKCKHCGEWLLASKRLAQSGAANVQSGCASSVGCLALLFVAGIIFMAMVGR